MASNMSSAPPAQDDQVTTGGWLHSSSSRYLVQSFLGRGSYGTVAKCKRMRDMRTVAIKMIKNQDNFVKSAKAEVAALTKLSLLDSDKCNLVRWHQVFTCRGHICLEFEHLDKSLYDFMKERYARRLLLKEIRPIVQQIATALNHLRSLKIIHADLKPANIMLVNHAQEPYRVKVIDFGLACKVSSAKIGSYIQSRPYRSPEILLGLPFTEAIDMWSLGCMAAEMYLGTLLYPGKGEYDMMRYIVEMQGQPSDEILACGSKTNCFFNRVHNSSNRLYKLKTPEQYIVDTRILPMETRVVKLKSLYDILNISYIETENSADRAAELGDRLMFVSMLNEMLQLDASKRAGPTEVLEHPFISMSHIVSTYPHSSYAKSSFDIMDICQNKTSSSGSGNAVRGSQQQSSSGTSHTVQQNLPPPSAVWSSLSQPHCSYHHPCSSTQTTGSLKSGMKRKIDHQDGTVNNKTSHPSKRVKSGWHRRSHAGQSTSSSSYSSNKIQASTAMRSSLTQPRHLHINTHPSQSGTGTGIKRKTDDEDVECHQTDSDHYKRSDHDRKSFRGSSAGPSASRSSSQTQRNVSPRVRRKRAHGEDKDNDERSYHERKRVRTSHAGPSTCSRESTRTLHDQPNQRHVPSKLHRHSTLTSSCAQTESRDRSGLKRKSAYEEDVQLRGASDKCGGRRNKTMRRDE